MADKYGPPGGTGLLPPARRGSQTWVSGRAVREVGKDSESRRQTGRLITYLLSISEVCLIFGH